MARSSRCPIRASDSGDRRPDPDRAAQLEPGAGRIAPRRDPHPQPVGLDQPQGRADRRSRHASASARASRPARQPVRLLSPAGAKGSYFASSAGPARASRCPTPIRVWTPSASTLSPGKPVTLSWTNPTGQRFEQIISVDDGYLFTIRQRVANLVAGADRAAHLRARQSRRQERRRHELDQPCRPDQLPRRRGRLRHRLGNARRGQAPA